VPITIRPSSHVIWLSHSRAVTLDFSAIHVRALLSILTDSQDAIELKLPFIPCLQSYLQSYRRTTISRRTGVIRIDKEML
jgi:hypothetical protein